MATRVDVVTGNLAPLHEFAVAEEHGGPLTVLPRSQGIPAVPTNTSSSPPSVSNQQPELRPRNRFPEVSTNPEVVEGCVGGPGVFHADTLPSTSLQSSPTERPSASAPRAPTIENVWDYSVPVPGSRQNKRIYPKAPVEYGRWCREQCHGRFVFIRSELAALVDKYLDLRGLERRPVYASRMVGTSPETALPSVVVTCRETDFKKLRILFRTKAEAKLLLGKESALVQLRSSLGIKASKSESVPRLQLVYYRTPMAPVIRMISTEPLETYLLDDEFSCGGTIYFNSSTATLGVTFDINDWRGTLTVDHLFSPAGNPDGREDDAQTKGPDSSTSSGEPNNTDFSWEDDDEYDDLDTYDSPPSHGIGASHCDELSRLELPEIANTDKIPRLMFPEMWERVIPPRELSPSAPYLDWALAKPGTGLVSSFSRPNTVFLNGHDRSPVSLSRIRREPPDHLASVYVVSGMRKIISGQILSDPIFLPSIPGREYYEAWSVILDTPDGLIPGECGSIVVDQKTNEVYGHIIGSDPLGHAYVVPLTHVLKQMETCFGANVKLRESSEVLTDTENESPKARGRRQKRRADASASEEEDSIIRKKPRLEKHRKPDLDCEDEVPMDIDRTDPSGATHDDELKDRNSRQITSKPPMGTNVVEQEREFHFREINRQTIRNWIDYGQQPSPTSDPPAGPPAPSSLQALEATPSAKGKTNLTPSDEGEEETNKHVWGYLFPSDPRYDGEHFVVRSRPDCTQYLIGRQPECDLVIRDPVVSNRHCSLHLEYKDNKLILLLQDLSSDGTFINGAIVGRGRQQELNDGDEISITGTASFTIRYPSSYQSQIFEASYILNKNLWANHGLPGICRYHKKYIDKQYICRFIPNPPADPDILRREIAEIKGFHHPNILHIRSSFESQGGFHLVLEHTGWGNLIRLITKKQKLDENETRALFWQLFDAVKYLHDHHMVHGDIRLGNVYLMRENVSYVKLFGFGLSQIKSKRPLMEDLSATPIYVAPEVQPDMESVNATTAADIWSLGVLLYTCACGFPPFSEELRSEKFPFSLREHIRAGTFNYPSPYWDSIGDPVLHLIDNMLVQDPRGRFTIEQCLSHPWLTRPIPGGAEGTSAIAKLHVDPKRRDTSIICERTLLSSLLMSQRELGRPVAGSDEEEESSLSTKWEIQKISLPPLSTPRAVRGKEY